MRRVALDLLSQAVDMGFERVSRDARVIAPHLAEQGIAADDPVAGSVEIFEDRGFFLGEADLLPAAAVDHQLGAGLKRVRPDRQHRIVAMLALPEMGPQARQKDAEPEWLGDIVIGTGIEPRDGVGLAIGRGQHQDWRHDAVAAKVPAQFSPIHVGEPDIEQDRVEALLARRVEGLPRGAAFHGREFAMLLQLFRQRMAQGWVVIDDQNLTKTAHAPLVRCPVNFCRLRGEFSIYSRQRRNLSPAGDRGTAANYPFSRAGAPGGLLPRMGQACAETPGAPPIPSYHNARDEVPLVERLIPPSREPDR